MREANKAAHETAKFGLSIKNLAMWFYAAPN